MSVRSLVLVVVVGLACSNRKTPVPGKTCLINSDCESPLACSFNKCHEACRENGDCANGARCVYAPQTGAGDAGAPLLRVCLLPVEEKCGLNSMCLDPLVCGKDLQCRQECAEARDCPRSDDQCVVGGPNGEKVCAEPGAVDPATGQLKMPDGGSAVDATTSGDSGGGVDASGVESGTDAAAPADAPIDSPLAIDSGADTGPVIAPEMEPNDDRTSATPYAIGTEVHATLGAADGGLDVDDFFVVTAPAGDPSGGYFQGSVTEVGNGVVHVVVLSATDNTQFTFSDSAPAGGSSSFFWAAAPGQRYIIRASTVGSPLKFSYIFKIVYTRIDDPFEPNDTRDRAAAISPGVPVTAYFFKGYIDSNAPVPDQDWFSLVLGAGTVAVSIQPVPLNLRLQFAVYDANFVQLATTGAVGANLGASINGSFTAPAGGTYRVQLFAFSFNPGGAAGAASTPPENFTLPYTLTVSQP